MNKPYVRVINREWGYNRGHLEISDGKTTWTKSLLELTSYIGVSKNKDEVKKQYCDYISEMIGIAFTVEDLDKIITPKDYKDGMCALREFEYIVESNIKAIEQGKDPVYGATSLSGSAILKKVKDAIK